MNIAGTRLQAPDQLLRLKIPDIDLALKTPAIEKRPIPCKRQYRLALLTPIFQRADVIYRAAIRTYPPQQYTAVTTSRHQHLFIRLFRKYALAQQHAMYVSIVRKLVYVLPVNQQRLPAHRVFRSAVRDTRFRCLYATGAERVEEAVLAFGGVHRLVGCRSDVFLLEVVPLYAGVLGPEVDGAMQRRVRDAEDVANIVGRPQRVEVPEGGRTPDLPPVSNAIPSTILYLTHPLTLTIGSVALENNHLSSRERQNPNTLPL
jgi:hypothetical protein